MKKIFSVILALAILLCACENDESTSSVEVSSEISVEVSSEETSSEPKFVEVFSPETPAVIDYEYERLESLEGLNIVNFGDSIYGIWRNETSVTGRLIEYTGANCYNAGISGATFAFAWDYSDYFTMHRMATYIEKEDFHPMKRTLDMFVKPKNPDSYFYDTHAMLKDIDWSKIDVITIQYGTNDFTNNGMITGNESEKQRGYFASANPEKGLYSPCEHYYLDDAVKYTLNTIRKSHPHIRIVVLTPTPRYDFVDEPLNDNGYALSDYAEHIEKVCDEWGVPCLDAYNEAGINDETYRQYFDGEDLVHLNGEGRKLLAKYIADNLLDALNSYCE